MSKYLTSYDLDKNIIRTVNKSNDLIRAYYDLSITEQKIILIAISYIEDPECRIVNIPLSSYKKYLGLESFNYEHFDKILKSLRQNTITIAKTDKNTGEISEGVITGFVDSIKIKDSIISVNFNKDIWDYLINLKKDYTKYQLTYVLKLKSKHSIRLFELLKSYEYLSGHTIKVNELRQYLYLDDKYPRYNDLDKKILEPAINEINNIDENFDIKISYIPIKIGVKYDSIKFTIQKIIKNNEDNIYPPEVILAKSMTEIELFSSIKTMLTMKYKCIFTNQDINWINVIQYSKYALESTYLSLLADDWNNHIITSHKAFFAEHLKRLTEQMI